jgi:serine/threonine protein kinase
MALPNSTLDVAFDGTAQGEVQSEKTIADRYLVLQELGAGGMGQVLAAYDVVMQRKVALKILRVQGSKRGSPAYIEASRRLAAEARALAKINHPGVVSIFDVNWVDGQVILCMELLEGDTLKAWLSTEHRSAQACLKVLIHAGRGLACAHACGLIHRDVKPDNIIVDRDGLGRVLDFGLASDVGVAQLTRSGISATSHASRTEEERDPTLTRGDEGSGTPRFMAPEQILGAALDQRVDVFAFCETVFLAIYGIHPFEAKGGSDDDFVRAKLSGQIVRLSQAQRRRGWPGLLPILRAGLQSDPERRTASMAELLDQIEALVAARQRRKPVLAALFSASSLVLTPIVWTSTQNDTQGSRCADPSSAFGELLGAGYRNAKEERFDRLNRESGVLTWNYLWPRLLDFRQEWIAATEENCIASGEHKTTAHSGIEVDAQRICLEDSFLQFRGYLQALDAVDANSMLHLLTGLEKVTPPRDCLDRDKVRLHAALPTNATERELVLGLRAELSALKGESQVNFSTELEPRFESLIARARTLESFSLLSDIFYTYAFYARRNSQIAMSDHYYTRALYFGLAAKNAFHSASAAIHLIFIRGYALADVHGGEEVAALAPPLIAAAGHSPLLNAQYYHLLGTLEYGRGEIRRSCATIAYALELGRHALGPDHAALVNIYNDYGALLLDINEPRMSLSAVRRAIAISERNFGNSDVRLPLAYYNAGEALAASGSIQEAAQASVHAVKLCEADFGKLHTSCAAYESSAAQHLISAGRYNEGKLFALRAQATQHHGQAKALPWEAWAEVALSSYAQARGKFRDAVDFAQSAVRFSANNHDTESATVASTIVLLASAQAQLGLAVQARETLNRLDRYSELVHRRLGASLVWTRSKVLHLEHRDEEAIALLSETVAHEDPSGQLGLPTMAPLHLTLATMLRLGGHYDRARSEAQKGLDALTHELGANNLRLSPYWLELGEIALANGHSQLAANHFREGLAVFSATEVPEAMKAPLLWGLARAERLLDHENAAALLEREVAGLVSQLEEPTLQSMVDFRTSK